MTSELSEFMKIESDPKIMEFKSPCGQPLWPMVRSHFYVISSEVLTSASAKKKSNSSARVIKKIGKIFKTLCSLPQSFAYFNHKSPIVFQRSPFGLSEHKGKMYDRTLEFKIRLFPTDSFVVCEEERATYPAEIPFEKRNITPILIVLHWLSKFYCTRSVKRISNGFFNYILDRCELTNINLSDSVKKELLKLIIFNCKKSCLLYPYYKWMWRKLDPKIIIYAVGMYGKYGESIRAANELGIETVEMQHGVIYSNHYAYSFNECLLANETLKQVCTKWMFFHGQWFAEKTNLTCTSYILGWPFLTAKVHSTLKCKRDTILFTPTGQLFEESLSLAQDISIKFPQYRVVIRPHPMDHGVAKKAVAKVPSEVEIDLGADLYHHFSRTLAVVGEMSTVLFCAICFETVILSKVNDFTRNFLAEDNPFVKFSTVKELISILKNIDCYADKLQTYDFFYPEWVVRYKAFLEDVLTKEQYNNLKQADISYL